MYELFVLLFDNYRAYEDFDRSRQWTIQTERITPQL